METKEPTSFKTWAVIELLGHRRFAGYVSEEEHFGKRLIRLDHPADEPADGFVSTQFYGAEALYCLTPTSEEIARAIAKRNKPEPVHRWELPPPPEAPVAVGGRDAFEQEDHDGEGNDDEPF